MLFAWTALRPPVADKLWATGGHRAAVYSRPFRQHQKTVLDIIIFVLCCFERKACWPMCVGDLVQLLLRIRPVLVSNAHVRGAFVHHIVRPRVIAWPRNVTSVDIWSLLLGLLSTQLHISIQKYRTVHVLGQQTWTALVDSLPVAKTDVQKLSTMLELRENGGRRHTRQRNTSVSALPGSCRRDVRYNSITGDTFWKPATGWKPVNRLTGYRFQEPPTMAACLIGALTRWMRCNLLLLCEFSRGQHRIHCEDVALKFIWMLGNRCPEGCEVRVNSYVTRQYRQSTRYLVRRVQRVKVIIAVLHHLRNGWRVGLYAFIIHVTVAVAWYCSDLWCRHFLDIWYR